MTAKFADIGVSDLRGHLLTNKASTAGVKVAVNLVKTVVGNGIEKGINTMAGISGKGTTPRTKCHPQNATSALKTVSRSPKRIMNGATGN